MDFLSISTIVGIPIIRSVVGWLESAFDDGKITTFEWTQLFATILRVGFIGMATFFGLNGLGVDIDALGASFSAVFIDIILNKLKKPNESKKRS